MIRSRLAKTDQVSTYKDWWLLIWALALGVTGMLAQITRLLDMAFLSYAIYYIHLMFVWSLFFFIAYSKLAHLVYRTTAMAYNAYIDRQSNRSDDFIVGSNAAVDKQKRRDECLSFFILRNMNVLCY